MDHSHAGSPTGTGNPPGKHSENYLSGGSMGGHFMNKAGYHSGMDVGMPRSAREIGNQPKQKSTSELGLRTKSI